MSLEDEKKTTPPYTSGTRQIVYLTVVWISMKCVQTKRGGASTHKHCMEIHHT